MDKDAIKTNTSIEHFNNRYKQLYNNVPINDDIQTSLCLNKLDIIFLGNATCGTVCSSPHKMTVEKRPDDRF